jgi:hypothetical protein
MRFDVVRQPVVKYVLLIETSSSMAGVWKWVRKAAQNLLKHDLPDNTAVAVVTFNTEAKVAHQLAALTSERARTRLADTIPDSANKLSRTDDRCVVCAVKVAMDQVLRNREAGAHLVLVTQGVAGSLTLEDQEVLTEYDKYYNVRLSSVLVPRPGRQVLPFYEDIATQSGGQRVTLDLAKSGIQVLAELVHAFVQVAAVDTPSLLPITVHQAGVGEMDTLSTNGEFLVDAGLGRDTVFGVFVEDQDNHRIKQIQFFDDRGSVHGPYTKMSSTFDEINLKTINFPIGEKPPFDEVSPEM